MNDTAHQRNQTRTWLTLVCVDVMSLVCTNWDLSAGQDLNPFNRIPLLPICYTARMQRWDQVRPVHPLSAAIKMSLVTFTRAVSVPCVFLIMTEIPRTNCSPVEGHTADWRVLSWGSNAALTLGPVVLCCAEAWMSPFPCPHWPVLTSLQSNCTWTCMSYLIYLSATRIFTRIFFIL